MKARYPWVAVRTDLARVGTVASDSYAAVAQRIVGRNLQCFARVAGNELRQTQRLAWPRAMDRRIDDSGMAGA